MEDMKNLIIQSLETKGVLGQIRANLRSAVFKMVNEQDQQFKLGCGLKWENPTLYKIIETKIGSLLSEIIREFMEYFRMDYSLSIFIPECGISPERLKKEEIFGKMGLFNQNEQFLSQLQLPLLYYILFFFMESIKQDPNKVMDILQKVQDNVETKGDEIIENNIMEYIKTHKSDEDDIPLSGDRTNLNNNIEINNNEQIKKEEIKNEQFESINQIENDNKHIYKKSYEYEDNNRKRKGGLSLDDDEEEIKPKEEKKIEIDNEIEEIPVEEIAVEEIIDDNKKDKKDDDIIESEEIEEKIEESYEQSTDKKSGSNNVQTISLSQGNDASVDSHALENYNYVEPVAKDKK